MAPRPGWPGKPEGWLRFWEEDGGLEGFYLFDLVAAAYLLRPALFNCADAQAWAAPDDRLRHVLPASDALLLGVPSEMPVRPRSAGPPSAAPACVRVCRGGCEIVGPKAIEAAVVIRHPCPLPWSAIGTAHAGDPQSKQPRLGRAQGGRRSRILPPAGT